MTKPPSEDPLENRKEELRRREEQLCKAERELEREQKHLERREKELDEAFDELGDERKIQEKELKQRRYKLSKDEASLADTRLDIERDQKKCARHKEELEKREAALNSRKTSLEGERKELDKRSRTLDRRAAEVEQREKQAEDDCQKIRAQELEKIRGEVSKLRNDLEAKLEDDLARERKRRRDELDAALEARRSEVEKDLAERREKVDELITSRTKELDQRDAELDERKSQLSAHSSDLDDREKELEARDAELERLKRRLEGEEEYLAAEKDQLDEEADRRAAQKIEKLQFQCDQRDERIQGLHEDLDLLQRKLDAYDDWQSRFGDREPEDILDRLRSLEKQLDEKREELLKRPTREDKERLDNLETQREGWEEARRELTRELAQTKSKLNDYVREVGRVEQQRDLYEAKKRHVAALNTTVAGLEEEVKRLQGIYEKPTERKARIGTIEEPIDELTKRLEKTRPKHAKIDEIEWLDQIDQRCQDANFKLPTRLLHSFHTSLKTAEASPITVLAGVSGTGKSMLPRVYAHFGGLQFFDVPVRPDWDSPQALFGFFNSIDNQFDSTELLRALVQASDASDNSDGFDDRMMIVLLDEMNLAHVELYFSDLLSKLESRRSKEFEELSIDLGASIKPYRLPLSDNVLWTGTMNQDATTKSLSDKVVDRSNIIVFPRPDEFIRRFDNSLGAPESLLHRKTWEKWQTSKNPFSDEEIKEFKVTLEQVNSRLEKVGRALGHRVWQSVEQYMLNYPTVIDARRELANAEDIASDTTDSEDRGDEAVPAEAVSDRVYDEMKKAFEDQVVLKVMPKLRGIETRGQANTDCLQPIREILVDELKLALGRDFEIACESGQGRFVWNSAHYVTAE